MYSLIAADSHSMPWSVRRYGTLPSGEAVECQHGCLLRWVRPPFCRPAGTPAGFCGNFGAMSHPPIEIETGPNPTATILLMHGLGADGNDFVPIAQELDLSSVGPVRFVFPNAPVMPVTINGGYQMPAWYDIYGPNLVQREDEAGLRRSQASIEALIEKEKSRGIAANRIVVAGFSQGCAM